MIIIKVLQIISANDIGGGAAHVLNLCYHSKHLFSNVLGCIGEGTLPDKAKKMGIETVRFSSKCFINGEIQRYVEENSIDVINFHGAKAFFTHYFINKKIKVPTVATVHSDYKKDFLNSKIKYYMFTPLSIKGIRSFKNHICVSKYIQDILVQDKINSKKFIVNNGIDLDKYKNIKIDNIETNNRLSNYEINRNESRKKLNINEEDFVYINIARMHPVKNHIGLVEAFSRISKDNENAKLLLLGDGVEEEKIRKIVKELDLKEKVIFFGFQENVDKYINIADVSILTSFSEGGAPPLVILESGINKVPVIASNVCDIPDCINENNGFLVNPNSNEDIYLKMKKAYENRERLQVLGKNLYKDICNKYSMENFCRSYYECYKSLI